MGADGVRLIREGDRGAGPSIAGMTREEAVTTDGLWAGFVRTEPRMASGWHHHGEYESAIYVLDGRMRIEFGTGGSEKVDAGPGDFIYVPKRAVHREFNPMDQEGRFVVVRGGSGEPHFNVDGPEPAG